MSMLASWDRSFQLSRLLVGGKGMFLIPVIKYSFAVLAYRSYCIIFQQVSLWSHFGQKYKVNGHKIGLDIA